MFVYRDLAIDAIASRDGVVGLPMKRWNAFFEVGLDEAENSRCDGLF